MKKLILLILSVLVTESVWSQVNSTDTHELASNENTRSELIQKCRNSIVDAIIEGDRDKATELMLYAKTTFDDDNYQTFTPDELWDLTIWLRKYKMAASEMAQFSLSAKQIERNKTPFVSNLLHFLKDSICNNIVFLESDINSNISLTSCERDFLLLYIKNFKRIPTYEKSNGTLMNNYGSFKPDTLNQTSNEFLQQHPGSDFESFVKSAMRFEYKQNSLMFGLGMDVGASLIGGDLAKVLAGSLNIGFNGHLYYKGAVAGVHIDLSFNKPKETLHGYNTSFGKGVKLNGNMPNFYLGYQFAYRKMMLMPTVGYGKFCLSTSIPNFYISKENGPETDWGPVFSIEIGFNTDMRYPCDSYATRIINALGIRYSYHPVTLRTIDCNYNGVAHNVTLMYRITIGKLKRIY